nr:hypothetical protein [Stackebrandtia nassauensis]
MPPLITATVRPKSTPWRRNAATVRAPDGSATRRASRATMPTAAPISSSETVTMSSTNALRCAKVKSDGSTRTPSAMVRYRSSIGHDTRFPARRLSAASAASSGSTPMTLVDGDSALTAAPTPEASPPPPTGTRIVSTSVMSARISTATVP